jgi:hypothetical protein
MRRSRDAEGACAASLMCQNTRAWPDGPRVFVRHSSTNCVSAHLFKLVRRVQRIENW